jgi:hypothetical protein
MKNKVICIRACMLLCIIICHSTIKAQTEIDGDMMEKKLLCVGPMYSYNSWDNYWEGTLKRNNLNLGTISTSTYSIMGNYGVSKDVNILFSVPYVQTKATAGTLHGMKGFQDLSLFVKWRPLVIKMKDSRLTLFAVAGYSTPLSNYMADYLPLSIGLQSNNLTGRAMADFKYKNVFATASAAYIYRSNITIDRNSYYTTEMHLTNKVEMPDMTMYNLRVGYRNKYVVAEGVLTKATTLGGFDISRNNMPFPSNRMNMTTVGANFRYIPKWIPDLNVNAGYSYTIAGRNVGQSSTVYGGLFYIFHLTKKATTTFNF